MSKLSQIFNSQIESVIVVLKNGEKIVLYPPIDLLETEPDIIQGYDQNGKLRKINFDDIAKITVRHKGGLEQDIYPNEFFD